MLSNTPPARTASRAEDNGTDAVPANLNPHTCPIIARHWFGIEPRSSIGQIAAEVVADLKFRRKVIRLHRQGPRAVGEFLAGLGAELGVQTPIERKLDTYTELDPAALEAAGGDFWPLPVRLLRIAGSSGNRAITRDSTA